MMTSRGSEEYDFNLTPQIFMIIILSPFSSKVLFLVVSSSMCLKRVVFTN